MGDSKSIYSISYIFLLITCPCYPIICILNELDNDNKGNGYYNFIPQIILPNEKRVDYKNKWPGLSPCLIQPKNNHSKI